MPAPPPNPARLAPGDLVRIHAQGVTRTGHVLSAVNYGTPDQPNWYIELPGVYWKQALDGGYVERLDPPPPDDTAA